MNSTQAMKSYLARKELGGGGWAEIRAMAENQELPPFFLWRLLQQALNMGVFATSETARENAAENAMQVGLIVSSQSQKTLML